MKVLMVYTANMNLGDSILAENDYWLLEKSLEGRKHTIFRYNISMRDIGQIKYVDAVVFGGGILKSTNEKFWLYIPEIVNEAQKYDIPVFFSAIGCEAFHPEDENSVSLKNAVNQPCVKGISCRDDIETLKNDYIENPDVRLTSVYDPAVWCRETYKDCISSKDRKTNRTIGLGVVRSNLFEDYGNPQITKQFQLDFWKKTAELLEEKGYSWTIFTNGDTYDERFAREVLAYIGHGKKERTPMDDRDLVSMISEFKGVIAGRMHSNIVAYALGITSVGFIWNRKLTFWGKKTGTLERYLTVDEMTAENAVDRLLKYIDDPKEPDDSQKMPVYEAMKEFADTYIKERPDKPVRTLDYSKHMAALNMGGMDLRYTRTNSVEALKWSIAHGFENFTLAVRMTSDQKLVCVDRWHRETYHMMNIPIPDEEKEYQPAMSFDQFSKAMYYNRFHTASFEQMIAAYSRETAGKKTKLFIIPGKPKQEELPVILKQIITILKRNKVKLSEVVLCFETRADIEAAISAKKGLLFQAGYELLYFPKIEDSKAEQQIKDAVKYCRANKVRYLRVRERHYTESAASLIASQELKACVFHIEKDSHVIRMIRRGADYAACRRGTPDYFKKLTGKE